MHHEVVISAGMACICVRVSVCLSADKSFHLSVYAAVSTQKLLKPKLRNMIGTTKVGGLHVALFFFFCVYLSMQRKSAVVIRNR